MRETDALDRFLAEERAKEFDWLDLGCMRMVAGWVARVGGPDVMADWHGQFQDEAGAWALVSARGGLPAVMSRALGPSASTPPARGDVGLFEWHGGQMGVICTGKMWAARRQGRGVALSRLQPQQHWHLGFVA